jgi:hypothetical protein
MAVTYHMDPGHGWLAVPVKMLSPLGLSVNDFTPYSYQSRAGTTVYLEEDCDASKFMTAFEAANGFKCPVNEKHTNARHWIRSLPSLQTTWTRD